MPRLRKVLEKAKGKMGEKSEVMIIAMHFNDDKGDYDYDKDGDDYHNDEEEGEDDETDFNVAIICSSWSTTPFSGGEKTAGGEGGESSKKVETGDKSNRRGGS